MSYHRPGFGKHNVHTTATYSSSSKHIGGESNITIQKVGIEIEEISEKYEVEINNTKIGREQKSEHEQNKHRRNKMR